jgi:hypothetical protein
MIGDAFGLRYSSLGRPVSLGDYQFHWVADSPLPLRHWVADSPLPLRLVATLDNTGRGKETLLRARGRVSFLTAVQRALSVGGCT